MTLHKAGLPIDKVIKKINLKNYLQVKISELSSFCCWHDLSFKVMEHMHHLIMSVCVDSDVAVAIKASKVEQKLQK